MDSKRWTDQISLVHLSFSTAIIELLLHPRQIPLDSFQLQLDGEFVVRLDFALGRDFVQFRLEHLEIVRADLEE